jgi:RNA polymerase sigma-70 factor (ECF subfamily)
MVETALTFDRQRPQITSLSGDSGAFEDLYRWYGALALYRIRAIVRDNGVAEEILQESMMAVVNAAHTFDQAKGNAGVWFLAIARNRALDHQRSNACRMAMQSVPIRDLDRCSPPRVDSDVEALERRQRIEFALDTIPAAQQKVIRMAFFEDLSTSEIALRLGEPLGTIKTRIRSALKNLRQRLSASEIDLLTAA